MNVWPKTDEQTKPNNWYTNQRTNLVVRDRKAKTGGGGARGGGSKRKSFFVSLTVFTGIERKIFLRNIENTQFNCKVGE